MTVIFDHSLLHLIIGLAGNQTDFLLDSGATHNYISNYWCSNQGIEVLSGSQFDIRLADQQTVPGVRTCLLLAALGPFNTVLRFYIIDSDVPNILGMPSLVTVNPQIAQ